MEHKFFFSKEPYFWKKEHNFHPKTIFFYIFIHKFFWKCQNVAIFFGFYRWFLVFFKKFSKKVYSTVLQMSTKFFQRATRLWKSHQCATKRTLLNTLTGKSRVFNNSEVKGAQKKFKEPLDSESRTNVLQSARYWTLCEYANFKQFEIFFWILQNFLVFVCFRCFGTLVICLLSQPWHSTTEFFDAFGIFRKWATENPKQQNIHHYPDSLYFEKLQMDLISNNIF